MNFLHRQIFAYVRDSMPLQNIKHTLADARDVLRLCNFKKNVEDIYDIVVLCTVDSVSTNVSDFYNYVFETNFC